MVKRSMVAVFLLMPVVAFAGRTLGFEADAFNRTFPVSDPRSIVFSPASFEIDCALVAESLPTIPKANVSEMLGVTIDLESTYSPMLEGLSANTNGFKFVAARGFSVSAIEKAQPALRQHLERVYGAEVVRSHPARGGTAWFRSTMEGEMENFELPPAGEKSSQYSFYDLNSSSVSWLESFPTANTRTLDFVSPDGSLRKIDFMADVRKVDTWDTDKFVALKLPLKGGANFYALMPKTGATMMDVRRALSSTSINELFAVFGSKSGDGFRSGNCAIVLPKFRIESRHELLPIMEYFQIPLRPLTGICGEARPRTYRQWVVFELKENGAGESPLIEKASADRVNIDADTRKLVFNRPFLFFVHHVEAAAIPVAGQFTGETMPAKGK